MWKIVVGYALKVVLVAGPLLVPWVAPLLGIDRSDPNADKLVCSVLSVVLLSVIFLVDLLQNAIPRVNAAKLREELLEELVQEKFKKAKSHLRFNVMILRRDFRLLWLGKTFRWAANQGFEPGQHHDVKLRFLAWQGVCGTAVRTEQAVFYDFRNLTNPDKPSWAFWNNPFYLFPPQAHKTREVLAIFSIPLMVRRGSSGNPHYSRPVGVLNVDAVSQDGAVWLEANWKKLKKPLAKSGRFLAALG